MGNLSGVTKEDEGKLFDTRWTVRDYELLPDDGKRYEILDGELSVNPAPSTRHQRIGRRLLVALTEVIEAPGLGEVFYAPFDVELDERTIVQPDLVIVLAEHLERLTEKRLVGPPDVAIEILSIGTAHHDRGSKFKLYARFGVQSYWLVDPEEDQVVEYVLEGSGYRLRRTYAATDTLTPRSLPSVSIDLEPIFVR